MNNRILYSLLRNSTGGGGECVSVTGATINSDGNLILTLSDSTTINAGYCRGENGEAGEAGTAGIDGISPTIEVYKNTNSIYQLKINNANGTHIITPNLIGTGATTTRYYIFDNAMYTNYLDNVYVIFNDNLVSLRYYVEANNQFCNSDSNYSMYINTTTFGWAGNVKIFNTEPVTISSTQMLLFGYISKADRTGESFKFIPANIVSGTTDLEKAQSIKTLLTTGNENIINIDFEYVYAANGVTEAVSLENVPDGEYYISCTGCSDNSQPKINDITIV